MPYGYYSDSSALGGIGYFGVVRTLIGDFGSPGKTEEDLPASINDSNISGDLGFDWLGLVGFDQRHKRAWRNRLTGVEAATIRPG